RAATRGGGYFFPLRRKKVTKKGATSLEEAIFFLYGNCGETMQIMPFPATYCGGVRERLRCAAHRGEACLGAWVTSVRRLVAADCRRVPTGRTVLLRLLPHIVWQCGACPVAVGVVVAVGADLRFKAMPRYHSNLRRGRRPRHPLFGLPHMFASDHCTLLCGCVGCPRLPPHFVRRDTQRLAVPQQRRARCWWASPNSGCHPPTPTACK
ncbi:MAG: hypothetical protein LBO63_07495, partial [Oscillospiraceae bacterium]|nr:hypothetical protein [Oscillospiraceae bacterium]